MKKRGLLALLVISLIIILVACAPTPTTPTTAPTAPTTIAPPTTTPVKPITLRFNTFEPATGIPVNGALKPWSEEVTRRSGGRVKIELYTDAALGPPPAAWERLTTGVTDIEWIPPGFIAGRFPLVSVMNLPMLGTGSIKVSNHILYDLYNKFPDMLKEAETQAKLMFLVNVGPAQIGTSKAPVHTMADLKGLKIRVPSKEVSDALTALGGTPIFMPVTECYLALERGVVDGLHMSMIGWRGYKLYDVVKYVNETWVSDTACWCTMNRDKWNSLPADIQSLLNEMYTRYSLEVYPNAGDTEVKYGLNKYKTGEDGKQFFPTSEVETGLWTETCRPLWKAWVAAITAKGFNGQAILDEALQLAMKYNQ